SGLSKEDIEKMKRDADANAADDAKKKEEVEVRNTAEHMAYTAEKSLRDNGDKVPAEVKADVEAKIAEVRKVKDGPDMTVIKTATEALSLAMQKIGEAMSKHDESKAGTQPEAGTNPEQGGGEAGDNVRDAEFKEKK
ncbi:MAG: Hsp70 family protein, partial [bacterium]